MAALIADSLVFVPAFPPRPKAGGKQKVQPGTFQDKKVQAGYGLDKDQPFAGADPDGTGLPLFREPPPAAVAAARKGAPTPHLPDGHPDLTGFLGARRLGATPSRKARLVRMARLTTRSARRMARIRARKRLPS